MSHAIDADGSYSAEIMSAELTADGVTTLAAQYAAMLAACTTEEKRAALAADKHLGSAYANGTAAVVEAGHHGSLQFYARELTTRALALAGRLEAAMLAAEERGYRKGYAAAQEDAQEAGARPDGQGSGGEPYDYV